MKGKVIRSAGRKLLLSALLLTGAGTVQSQAQAFNWNVGPQAGISFDNYKSNVGKWKGSMGYHVGLANEFRILKKFSVEADLLLQKFSASRDYKDSALLYDRWNVVRYKTTENYQWMGAHILFKYNIALGHNPIIPYDRPNSEYNTSLSLFGGGFINHLAFFNWGSFTNSGTYTTYQVTNTGTASEPISTSAKLELDKDKNKYVNPTNYGILLGLGLNFKFSPSVMFSVDTRYVMGLNNQDYGQITHPMYGKQVLYTDPDPTKNRLDYQAGSVKTQSIFVSFGLKFMVLGKESER